MLEGQKKTKQKILSLGKRKMEESTKGRPKAKERLPPINHEVDGQWLTFPFPFVHHQPLPRDISFITERVASMEVS